MIPNKPKGGSRPKDVAVQMINKVYDQLEKKDMPRDQFVRECMGEISNKMKRKNSPLILPGD